MDSRSAELINRRINARGVAGLEGDKALTFRSGEVEGALRFFEHLQERHQLFAPIVPLRKNGLGVVIGVRVSRALDGGFRQHVEISFQINSRESMGRRHRREWLRHGLRYQYRGHQRAECVTHVWLTGCLRQATLTAYPGLAADDPDIVKGRAGSFYVVRDYFDVCLSLTIQQPRMTEFEALINQLHTGGLKSSGANLKRPAHSRNAREDGSDLDTRSVQGSAL
jgi:hypothetical protein